MVEFEEWIWYPLVGAFGSLLVDLLLSLCISVHKARTASVKERCTGKPIHEVTPFSNRLQVFLAFETGIGCAMCRFCGPFRRFLISDSRAKGDKYDKPCDPATIREFSRGYGIDESELLLPIEAHSTLNEFFYRKLKAGARPISEPDNPNIATVPCDCRLHVFRSILQATELYIKAFKACPREGHFQSRSKLVDMG
ncbi:hypothetical protein CYMTET_33390 [Cymbomonas tetramitiformis]|uniref:Uncharacterized protein n=1 Tax=Cymbomonas tetramitiformis TaxID=36881 RepID=A0AAE0FD80_9CHLO|nr:hypothetical protein CYMTET_33390 [Cymbomonas tetramitiformis]